MTTIKCIIFVLLDLQMLPLKWSEKNYSESSIWVDPIQVGVQEMQLVLGLQKTIGSNKINTVL